MKTKFAILLLVCACYTPVTFAQPTNGSDSFTEFTPQNLSTNITVPAAWTYGHAPGYYFWSGVRYGFGVIAFCMIVAMFRNMFSDREEL